MFFSKHIRWLIPPVYLLFSHIMGVPKKGHSYCPQSIEISYIEIEILKVIICDVKFLSIFFAIIENIYLKILF